MINASPVFSYQSSPIRTTVIDEGIWFVAADVCRALEIPWSGATLKPIPHNWQGLMRFITPSGNQQLRVISEAGLYKLAFRSNKPKADAFTNWVSSEVLPAIRKTGKYEQKQKVLPPVLDPEQQIMDAIGQASPMLQSALEGIRDARRTLDPYGSSRTDLSTGAHIRHVESLLYVASDIVTQAAIFMNTIRIDYSERQIAVLNK